MDVLALPANKREVLGKKTKHLRRQGIIPVHLFGHGIDSLALQCHTAELQQIISRAGKTRLINLEIDTEKTPKSVFIREIQRDPVSRQLLHVDFYEVRKGEKIEVDVPIVLVGEAPAMKAKGRMLTHGINTLSIECLPDRVPPQIEIDLSSLIDLEQAIHVRDIILDPSITVNDDPGQLVVKVSEAIIKEVVEEKVVEEVAAAEAEAGAPTEGEAKEQPAGEQPPR